jgi:hypothetical protein
MGCVNGALLPLRRERGRVSQPLTPYRPMSVMYANPPVSTKFLTWNPGLHHRVERDPKHMAVTVRHFDRPTFHAVWLLFFRSRMT